MFHSILVTMNISIFTLLKVRASTLPAKWNLLTSLNGPSILSALSKVNNKIRGATYLYKFAVWSWDAVANASPSGCQATPTTYFAWSENAWRTNKVSLK